MAIYNFQNRFAAYVKNGTKFHTIRSIRKFPCKVGDKMHLYEGLRTTDATKLIKPPPLCTAKQTIIIMQNVYLLPQIFTIQDKQDFLQFKDIEKLKIYKCLTQDELNALAYNDGFKNEHMPAPSKDCSRFFLEYFRKQYGAVFIGHLDIWHPQPQTLNYLYHE